ncbi:MAG TPA: zf-HC2 domain-containing protein [Thermoanaerobaculia bacterium]|nr:zf-HC2 domain-containing protein [Thermoanaerobaculia bacterium]
MSDAEPGMRTGEEVTCKEVLDFLWAYVAGELPAVTVEEFERHLAVCPSCVNYLESYKRTIELSRGVFEPESGAPEVEEMPEDLLRAVLTARRGE